MTIPILEIQRGAIERIKKNWGLLVGGAAIVIVLGGMISSVVGGIGSFFSGMASMFSTMAGLFTSRADSFDFDYYPLMMMLGMLPVSILLGIAAGVLENAVIAPLTLGYNRMALSLTRGGKAAIDWLFTAFKSFWRYAAATLWVMLWTGLWSLLFIVPGIIKGLAYSQTLWLVVEYPDLSVREAMRLSIRMTNGYKGDIFVAQLLLMAWGLITLVAVCTIIGPVVYLVLWLMPLQVMLMAGIYQYILSSALSRGVVTPQQLGRSDIPGGM